VWGNSAILQLSSPKNLNKMKNNLIAFVIAALTVPLLFSQCDTHPDPKGEIRLQPDSARKHIIPIDTAIKMNKSYIAARRRLAEAVRKGGDSLENILDIPYDESFNRDIFALLLNQKGAAGIRIYLGKEEGTNKGKLIMVPVDKNGRNIIEKFLYKGKPVLDDQGRVVSVPGISSATAATKAADGAEKGGHCSPPCPLSY